MAGLIQQANEAAMQEEPMAQEQEPEQVEGEQLTDEEDEAYQAGINMAAEMLYKDDQSSEAFQAQLAEGDPLQSIADLTMFLVAKIEEAFQGQVPETIIIPLADEISDLVMEMGFESGAFDLSDDEIVQAKGFVINALFDEYGLEEADLEGMLEGVTADEVAELQQAFKGGV
jgi:hypothetical protein